MRRARTRNAASLLAVMGVAFAASGCSADAVDVPEPDATTPGAFVGIEEDAFGETAEGSSSIVIIQVRGVTGTPGGDRILIVDVLEAEPRSFEEARALVRGPDLPVRSRQYLITLLTVLTHHHEVLWFRSLDP
jgi:hypothetical protein